ITAFLQHDELSRFGALGTETVGLLAVDEPSSYSEITNPIQSTPNSQQDGRLWWTNFTHSPFVYGDVGGVPTHDAIFNPVYTPKGTTRHLDTVTADFYWFAGAEAPVWQGNGGSVLGLGRDATPDEMSRGSNYGYMVDLERTYTNGAIPLYQFVEV